MALHLLHPTTAEGKAAASAAALRGTVLLLLAARSSLRAPLT
jgi:hypothetical protein